MNNEGAYLGHSRGKRKSMGRQLRLIMIMIFKLNMALIIFQLKIVEDLKFYLRLPKWFHYVWRSGVTSKEDGTMF